MKPKEKVPSREMFYLMVPSIDKILLYGVVGGRMDYKDGTSGRMIMTGEKPKHLENKISTIATCLPKILYKLAWDQTRAYVW
jgi:hypothetical protein